MNRARWVTEFRTEIDMITETMSRIRARRKEWDALDLSNTLIEEDCGNSNVTDITNAVVTWDLIDSTLTNAHLGNLIRAKQ